MPELQTFVDISDFDFKIGYNDTTSFFGSCFSTNIGRKFLNLKFNTLVNPFGVLYNPASISKSIDRILQNQLFTEGDLNFYDNFWFSFAHYTSFSDKSKTNCLNNINSNFTDAVKKMNNTSVLVLTLGTSYIYRLKENGCIVANCHKIPDSKFSHEFLKTNESVTLLAETIQKLNKSIPSVRVIITISPIRHWKDGAIENQRSKSALVLAAQELEHRFDNVHYFPVYEIFMDELRDYRFYARDMLHPSEFAVDYVWEKFSKCFFDSETIKIIKQVEKLNKSLQHRPVNVESVQHQLFRKKLKEQIGTFSKKYPGIDYSKELSDF
jgi:hypothetical protein